jgi:prevent-host-death family protein
MVMSKTALAKKKSKAIESLAGQRQMAAGEFKAKCLAIMDEVKNTGKSVVVTKRGEPVIKVVPIGSHARRKKSLLGRLVGVMTIVGDPDDLLKPIFPLEDYDMLK